MPLPMGEDEHANGDGDEEGAEDHCAYRPGTQLLDKDRPVATLTRYVRVARLHEFIGISHSQL